MRPSQQFSFSLSIILLGVCFAAASDFDSAKRAYDQKDYATAYKQAIVLAEKGNPDAQVLLGKMYLRGRGVLTDPDTALKWFKAAAAQGNADGEFLLGSMYLLPHSNIAEGLKWMRLAADQGNQDAQLLLGKTYLEGLGSDLPRDPVQADMWLRLAATHNLPFYENELRGAEQQMNSADIAKGKALADAWKPARPALEQISRPEKPKS